MGLLDNFQKIPDVRKANIESATKGNELKPHEVTLKSGIPLYHVFLNVGPEGTVDRDASEAARLRLTRLIDFDPKTVLSCQGNPFWQARQTLEALEKRLNGDA